MECEHFVDAVFCDGVFEGELIGDLLSADAITIHYYVPSAQPFVVDHGGRDDRDDDFVIADDFSSCCLSEGESDDLFAIIYWLVHRKY